MRTKNYIPDEKDWFTLNQLRGKNLAPIDKENCEEMWSNGYHELFFAYYHISNTRPATEEDYAEEKAKEREKARKYRERKKSIKLEKQKIELYRQQIREYTHLPEHIAFDTETTGLSANAEILQLSIIDGTGKVLLNKKYKPMYTEEWEEAEHIHGISKEDVKDCPHITSDIDLIQSIIDEAKTFIGYNIEFDIEKLENVGIKFDAEKAYVDVMKKFAPIYGEWNEYHQSYNWQSLATCARYYEYFFDAHDSLEDSKATLYCWQKMKEQGY